MGDKDAETVYPEKICILSFSEKNIRDIQITKDHNLEARANKVKLYQAPEVLIGQK